MEVKEEENTSTVLNGRITGIKFALASVEEIQKASISDFPISHASQLSNPFLGLPLENGRCESCGAAEAGQCEGHFGYIELPIPIYHPSHVSELKRLMDTICLKCLDVKKVKNAGLAERALSSSSCCQGDPQISIKEGKTTDGACYLELKINKSKYQDGDWNFLRKYGYRYGDSHIRPLLASEVLEILKKLPEKTKKKLSAKGIFAQEGCIMQYLPVPPNCLSVPDVSDGITIMSSDASTTILKKIMKKIEIIKTSRSGTPNFESYQIEANGLQSSIAQYLEVRGTSKSSRDVDSRYGNKKDPNASTKSWLEKMKTLFIRKGSGFSSRSVITGDAFIGVNQIGLPAEIAQRITFDEKVTEYNMQFLQKLVDEKLCLGYTDGKATYSLKEGSKGHTFLRPGQVVQRRVMDGDIVFINRPPTTHKHSLQALSVYIHDDHTVKINPLICGPLSADFDGDCVHLFYPQSLAAKAEVVELFSVEKQLLSSHNSKLNLQVATDSLLSLKVLFRTSFLPRASAQQLAMYLSNQLPEPAFLKPQSLRDQWTASQILQTALPRSLDCVSDTYTVQGSEILNIEISMMQSSINEILAAIFKEKGPDEVLRFLNSLQPMLMENLFKEGFTIDLKDFYVPRDVVEEVQNGIQEISPLLDQVRLRYNELVEMQIDAHLWRMRKKIADSILSSSRMGNVIDSKSDAAMGKVVQQVGFLGIQLTDKGKFYTKTLVGDMASLFRNNYPLRSLYPSEEFGLVRGCLFHGLDPFQEMVHSISAREVIVRSSRGLTEPGTLFKNLMAILRDVNVCYDGTVRNVCSNAIIQFQYGLKAGSRSLFAAGEPVGVLAATAMSNPAYKAVLDSSSSSNSSWELMKEILLCPATFKNDVADRRVTLYLSDCECGRKYCRENAAYAVKNHVKKVSLKDIAVEFAIEYHGQQVSHEGSQLDAYLVAHVHMNQIMFQNLHVNMLEICEKVQDRIDLFLKQKGMKKRTVGQLFQRLKLSGSEGCGFGNHGSAGMPCLTFFWQDLTNLHLDETSQALAHLILPVILEAIIKGDPRVCTADIVWIAPDTTTWIRNPSTNQNGELAVEIVLEKHAVKQSGDAWRVVMDACLPLIHLIDTTRSAPNAIKQVQELLGISCAFNQAVERLLKSVTMVTKGIMKEHLILLANSMSQAGSMVGFNSGGIKALSKSSNVRGPFAEATLFTPKKCFERAAEKGHVDSLSSIVASCSWGKQVSVGTGSRFDILWDTKEVAKDQGIDVYDFMMLVRSSKEEADCGGLGADVDELDADYDAEECMSPEHGADKPTFEDAFEFQNGSEVRDGDSNGNATASEGKWGSGGGAQTSWDAGVPSKKPAQASWGAPSQQPAQASWGAGEPSPTPAQASWGAPSPKPAQASWGAGEPSPKPAQSTWGAVSANKDDILERPMVGQENDSASDSWGFSKKSEPSGGKPLGGNGNGLKIISEAGGSKGGSNWGKSTGGDWGSTVAKPTTQAAEWSKTSYVGGENWGKSNTKDDDGEPGWGKTVESSNAGQDGKWGESYKKDEGGAPASGKTVESSKASEGGNWRSNKTDDGGAPAWGTWGKTVESPSAGQGNNVELPPSTGEREEWGRSGGGTQPAWGTTPTTDGGSGSSWGLKTAHREERNENPPSNPWKSSQNDDSIVKTGAAGDDNPWGGVISPSAKTNGSTWGGKKSSQGDDNPPSPGNPPSQWGQPRRFNNNNNNGKREQNDKPRGWGSAEAGRWDQKKAGGGGSALFTATRQRLDMFTSEEQEIIQVVDPIMNSIRRIMSGYNDEDPLSADHESYILENAFNYHPEKTAKMGVGIDYIMANKHGEFQDSRCLYVVLTDGHKEDFSYRKCLENFVRIKYPDLAEEFNPKYFKKPPPRPPQMNRGRNVGPEEASGQQVTSQEEAAGGQDDVPEEARTENAGNS